MLPPHGVWVTEARFLDDVTKWPRLHCRSKMSITSVLLTIVALAVVLRCSAEIVGTDWATINNCLKEERNESMEDVHCVTTQVSYTTCRRTNNCHQTIRENGASYSKNNTFHNCGWIP